MYYKCMYHNLITVMPSHHFSILYNLIITGATFSHQYSVG